MTTTARPSMGARDVLRLPDFRRLWAAVAIALAIPPLTIGLVAGTYADRFDRRWIMITADVLRAIVVLGFVLVASADLVPLLVVLAFVQSSIGTFFTPARGALEEEAKSKIPAMGYTVTYAVGNILLTTWGLIIVLMMS